MTARHRIEDTQVEGFAALALHAPSGVSATFCPEAGLLGCSLRDGDTEFLGTGEGVAAYVDHARWCGIPLLHPWANRLRGSGYRVGGRRVTLGPEAPLVRRDGNGRPIHGVLAGAKDWRVVERGGSEQEAFFLATLDFAADADRLAAFPFPHELDVRVSLADRRLAVVTRLRATGSEPVPVAFGWHPYFRLPGVPREEWEVDLPVTRRAELDPDCLPTGEIHSIEIAPGPLGRRTYDDLFPGLRPGAPFVLAGGGRRLEVTFDAGYDVAVVYAPGDADVICFEPMTAPTDPFGGGATPRFVAPGGTFEATFTITVRA